MATIRQRGNRWQVQVRRNGHAAESKSFLNRQDAEKWARSVEVEIDRGSFVSASLAEKTTLGELIQRYMVEVTPTMKGAKEDTIRLKAICRRKLCRLSVAGIKPMHIAQYRDERLSAVSAGTVIRELAYLSSIINHARREWGINASNPTALVRKPPSPKGRDRVLTADERAAIAAHLSPIGRRRPWMLPLFTFALETGMRRSEILSLLWRNVDLSARTALLEDTKNNERRCVPLSTTAINVLSQLPRDSSGRVFPMSACAVSAAFDRAAERAGVHNVHFHDLRHTAITALATKLPNLIELSAVSGHKSLKMLQRYYHPRASDLALKLG